MYYIESATDKKMYRAGTLSRLLKKLRELTGEVLVQKSQPSGIYKKIFHGTAQEAHEFLIDCWLSQKG